MDKDWKDRLRNIMQDYEEPEPEGLWQAISDAMDKGAASRKEVMPVRKHRRASAAGRYIITALSAAAAITVAVYFSFNGNRTSQPDVQGAIAVITDTASTQKPEPPATEQDKAGDIRDGIPAAHNLLAETHTPASPVNILRIPDARKGQGEAMSKSEEKGNATVTAPTEDVPGNRGTETAAADTELETDTIRQDKGSKREGNGDRQDLFEGKGYLDADRPAKKPRRGTFHASVSSSNLVGTSASFSGYSGLASASTLSVSKEKDEIVQTRAQAAASQKSSGTAPSGDPYNTEIRHRQPVRVGVSVRYDFTKRWGVETGLTYSMLSSTTSTGGSGYSSRAEQELHYIGIPLQISYEFLQLKWFSMYVNAGGMMEKCISGKTVTNYIPEGEAAFETRENIVEKPVQWSLNAAIGAEVHFTPFLGLYVEPGVGYFFNDGSSISTIYKERPFNFNFEFGLRFTFR